VRMYQGCMAYFYSSPIWAGIPGEYAFNVTATTNNTFLSITITFHSDVIGSTETYPNPVNVPVKSSTAGQKKKKLERWVFFFIKLTSSL